MRRLAAIEAIRAPLLVDARDVQATPPGLAAAAAFEALLLGRR